MMLEHLDFRVQLPALVAPVAVARVGAATGRGQRVTG